MTKDNSRKELSNAEIMRMLNCIEQDEQGFYGYSMVKVKQLKKQIRKLLTTKQKESNSNV